MNRKILITILSIALISLILPSTYLSKISADERYYYKGAAYTGKFSDDLFRDHSIEASSVVVSTSTNYTADKERVRAFTRCWVIEDYFDGDGCRVNELSVFLGSPDNVAHLIGTMSPNETQYASPLPDLSWVIRGTFASIGYDIIKAAIMSSATRIEHKREAYNRTGWVNYKYPNLADVELPYHVTYDNADVAYYDQVKEEAIPKGALGFFDVQYGLAPGQVGYLRAGAKATYRVTTYPHGLKSHPYPLVVQTGGATIVHSITGK